MLSNIIAFLVMLNPFAMFLYLLPVMEELSNRDFMKVLFKASAISFGIFAAFMGVGDILFQHVFQINFESFRIFGGIIIFSFAYIFIVKGNKAFIHMKESLDDLASEIALPFMVGAGTLSLSIVLGHHFSFMEGVFALLVVLSVNYFAILLIKNLRGSISSRKFRIAFDKNMQILLRLNGFFIGAIGINMILTGVKGLFF